MQTNTKASLQLSTNPYITLVKGVFWAISFSLISILLFAFIIKFTEISEMIIMPINQIIKILSILIGCWTVSKKVSTNGWWWGLLVGLFYTILVFLIFSLLDGEFRFSINILNDLVFGSIIGLLGGVLTHALRK